MLRSKQFRVNEAWMAIKLNDSPLIGPDESYDVYVLMDVASTYVFGHVFTPAADELPLEVDVEALFKDAWGTKKEWPKKLIVPENFLAKTVFRKQAEKHGFMFDTVPLSDLSLIVGPLKKSFASAFQ